MLHALVAFLPVAAALALSPGPATAMVVHTAARVARRGRPFRRGVVTALANPKAPARDDQRRGADRLRHQARVGRALTQSQKLRFGTPIMVIFLVSVGMPNQMLPPPFLGIFTSVIWKIGSAA
jgi:hypothetical protein